MLIQKTDILCTHVLHKDEERVRHIAEHTEYFYTEFHRYKTDKLGNKKLNKPQYARFGKYWTRIINPPKNELKEIQKQINGYLVKNVEMPGYAFGGIKKRDNIRNARFHKGQKYVFQTDLKDFFPYITHKLVYEMYVRVGFSHDVASLLTKLTTYKGHLPQGAPTSTTIANLVFMPTGLALQAISEREGLRFTTFVDDVTMSSQSDFKHVVPEIVKTIESSGFKISHGKTTYKSGITDITGVKMLNNFMTVTDKFNLAFAKEEDVTTPRAKGLLNYKERIKSISKSKNK
jgi:RNA-directed DNA polymerase